MKTVDIVATMILISFVLIMFLFLTRPIDKAFDQSINLMIEDSTAIIDLGKDEDNHKYYQLDDTMYEVYPDGTITKYY
jgi:hypothetical protein